MVGEMCPERRRRAIFGFRAEVKSEWPAWSLSRISFLDRSGREAYGDHVGGVNAPREYGSSGDRALRMVCRTSLYWEA